MYLRPSFVTSCDPIRFHLQQGMKGSLNINKDPVRIYQLSCGIWEISESPEAVLDKPLATMSKMNGQCIHATFE